MTQILVSLTHAQRDEIVLAALRFAWARDAYNKGETSRKQYLAAESGLLSLCSKFNTEKL